MTWMAESSPIIFTSRWGRALPRKDFHTNLFCFILKSSHNPAYTQTRTTWLHFKYRPVVHRLNRHFICVISDADIGHWRIRVTGMCKRIKFQRIEKTLKTNMALVVKDDVEKCSEKIYGLIVQHFLPDSRVPCFIAKPL